MKTDFARLYSAYFILKGTIRLVFVILIAFTILHSFLVQNRRQSLWNNNPEAIAKNLGLNEENVDKIALQRGDSRTKMEYLESLPKFISSPPPPSPMEHELERFNGLKTFRLVCLKDDV